MESELFDDLVKSLKEAADISKGKAQPSRRFVVSPPDVKAIREKTGLSQKDFAHLLRVGVGTLQNWEQHRRNPAGPAAVLLKIVATNPELAIKALHA